jgi:hypothetical protein
VKPQTRHRRGHASASRHWQGVARQATKAGISVAGYEVRPDGTIKVITGKPVGGSDIEMDDTTASPDPKWN